MAFDQRTGGGDHGFVAGLLRPMVSKRARDPLGIMIRHCINRVSTVLCLCCLGVLAILIGVDITTGYILCEGYLSGFFGWAFIFALVAYFTRPTSRCSP